MKAGPEKNHGWWCALFATRRLGAASPQCSGANAFRLLAILRALTLAWTFGALPVAAADSVATVNDQPISSDEFAEAVQDARSRRHADGEAAWRQAALEACVRVTVIEQLAQSYGLLEHVGYAARQTAFAEENKRRFAAKTNGGIVYGPVPLSWEQFGRLRLDRLELALRDRLRAAAPPPTDDELRRFYADHPALFTARGESVPRPWTEVASHARRIFERTRFENLIRERIAAANIRFISDLPP